MTPRLLITGATGFVGTAVCELAVRRGLAVKGALRIREKYLVAWSHLWLVK